MKRALLIVLAMVISVAFVTAAFAQAPAEKPAGTTEKAPAAEKKAPAAKAKTEKSVSLKGEVVKNDGKEMTVKGPKGEEKFDVSGVKNADKYKEGDKVTISYKEKDGKLTASSIKKPVIKGKTEKKEVKEKTEKPAPEKSAPAK
jgi:Cu/Ag efflux protein CusF